MKIKIFGIFICMLLIGLSVIPALKSDYSYKENEIDDEKSSSCLILKEKQLVVQSQEKDQKTEKTFMKHVNDYLKKIITFKSGTNFNYDNYFQENIKSENELDTTLLRQLFTFNSLQEEYNIKGYVTDDSTNQPIYQAGITLFWPGSRESIDRKYTETDLEGFYDISAEIGLSLGSIHLLVKAPGYFDEVIEIYDFVEDFRKDEQLWCNVSLKYGAPPEKSIICGYLTDKETNEPIANAELYFNSYDYQGEYVYWNFTQTNSDGFFKINVAPGEYNTWFHSDDYYYNMFFEGSDINILNENEVFWVNGSFIERPQASANIHGQITDKLSGQPIEDVYIVFLWAFNFYKFDIDWTVTDSSGNYKINVPPGYPPYGGCMSFNSYFDNIIIHYKEIKPLESIKIDVGLQPHPPDNAFVNGYVKDALTNEPIIDAEIYVFWDDYENYYYLTKETKTDSSGFYSLDIPAGEISVYFQDSEDKYFTEYSHNNIVNESETLTIDFYPYPYPDEKSIVCGYITDKSTGDPIPNAYIYKSWEDDLLHYDGNSTYADSTGFYIIDCAAGRFGISASAHCYFEYGSYSYEISDYETVWVNLSLKHFPPENSVVKGYFKDNKTNEQIEYAMLDIYFICEDGRYYKTVIADTTGFFSFNAPAGSVRIRCFNIGYLSKEIRFEIQEPHTYWINISMDEFKMKLTKPTKGLYINNARILPFLFIPIKDPIIIGNIEIELEVNGEIYLSMFFINDELKNQEYRYYSPCNWTWDERCFGKYKLKVIVMDESYFSVNFAGDEITVWKFF